MKNKTITYNYLILFHFLIALAVFVLPVLSKLYALIIPIAGIYLVNKTKNRNNEVLLVCAYLVGVEVFLRMTGGNFNNEYVKFNLVFFMFLGMIYSSFSPSSFIYWFFLILLIPCILITASVDQINIDVKKLLFFNLSGPVCLGVCSIYMYSRRIQFSQLQNILSVMGLPILTTTVYLFLYTPSVRDVVTSTGSNFETSGGFGPNQVSTILGLGIFIFFTQLVLSSKSIKDIILNGFILAFISYRGVVTFSRGGVITGVVMIVCLLFFLYQFSNAKGKTKFGLVLILTSLMGVGVWTYSSIQTRGLIDKRYANKDALGRVKKSNLSGREEIMDTEIKFFLDNPIMGIGAGMGKELRKESGDVIASHNEITRMLAEHGMFGVFGLLILFITPLILFINNRQHLYCLSFYLFWLLTINHAAMRIAAPAFVYALALLSVRITMPEKAEK
ncbi:O-antigen ligase family protein [Flavobacterium sp. LC2016-01]|uniref:O-antigen ligase family protein n=1 Tax=Flavobacterium sp. LC2016-01 TaxID=2675876 RepID=UPI0012BAB6A4|nr:O-antigen ligase family protein [Flavobacterium sp. LC2016-01]MTH17562.1 O-antigen ligase domain-containing protein [Flavobacterium sp. LC2016-01]